LTRRLEDIYRAFAMSAFGTLRERLAAHLLDSAEWAETGGLVAPMTHREMAEALGSAREVVTRGLHDLQHEGAIEAARGGTQIANLTRWLRSPDRGGLQITLWLGTTSRQVEFRQLGQCHRRDRRDRLDRLRQRLCPNARFRWQPSDLIGQPLTALIPPGPAFGFGRHLASWLSEPREGPIGFGRTFHGLRADGSTFPPR
jgi:hypothetical protein